MEPIANKPSSISLNGFFGEFKTPSSNFIIHFFSTIPNTKDPGYNTFLDKLEPLRDKTSPATIKDLGSLLQRDLSDLRIANELLPYLLNSENKPSHIAFFPSVLCVLMPQDFLQKDMESSERGRDVQEVIYPSPSRIKNKEGNEVLNYSNAWETFEYFQQSSRTRLGRIEIFEGKSDFLVLDGQHRTNAFKAAAGDFPKSSSIYECFYKERPHSTEEFQADLSVTLIWFETLDSKISIIEPDLISRKLFVDVNNSARSISKSRLILLDDSSPNHLLTRFYYSYLSTKFAFDLNCLSLS